MLYSTGPGMGWRKSKSLTYRIGYPKVNPYDDIAGFRIPGSSPSPLQPLFSTSGMVAVINSIIAAVFAGLLAYVLFQRSTLVSIEVGVVILLVTLWPHR